MYVKTLKPFVFLVVVIAMVSLACLGGSETPTEEPPAPPPAKSLLHLLNPPNQKSLPSQKNPLSRPRLKRKNSL